MGTNPCVIGVASHTYRGLDAPEPLEMWAEVVADAAHDTGSPGLLGLVDGLEVTYCQTWQYDDAPLRLADKLGIEPAYRYYSGIGGTTPQQLVNRAAEQILASELDIVVIASAEALATQAAAKKRGERRSYSFAPAEKRPFPWEAPFHPSEVAHDVFQAWLQFALFDNARRAHLGIALDDYRHGLGEMFSPMTSIAAANRDAWFPTERTVADIVEARPDNRMVGYPYTKYMMAVMDVDMAAAVVLTCDEVADRLGVPRERRVYLRGWCYATDPVYVAEHAELDASPAMRGVFGEALRTAHAGVDDIAHFDLYSCFGSSLNLARDALELRADDPRALTVTGGLPYHGGPGSGYMTHSIAQMVRVLRDDAGALGLTTGVGMANTKHVAGVWSTDPGDPHPRPDEAKVRDALPAPVPIVERHDGDARVAAYSVVHGRDGAPEWGLLVCDVEGGRCYARLEDHAVLAAAEREELVGATVRLEPHDVTTPAGDGVRHLAIR